VRLSWSDESKTKEEWKRWKYWSYIENTKEQFDLEELIGLITKPHMLTVPDEIDMAVDSKGNLWIIYRANDGAIYLARANDTLDDWVYHERLLYVPSGSTYPTIVFDNNDRHVIAAEFLPAGSEQKEIWLYEPPYAGDGIRRIVDGQYPTLAKDVHGERFLFYQAVDGDQVLYRKSSEAFAVEHDFETLDNEVLPRSFRIYHKEVSPYHDIYKHLMFYQADGEALPRYKMSSPTDFYTVGLDLYITDSQGQGISGAIVEVEGQSGITNKDGLVTFFNLPFDASVEIKLSHPFLGLGDTQHIFIPESAKGNHVSWALVFEIPKLQEYVEPYARVVALTWQGTEYIEHLAEDELYLDANLGIEWEEVRSPEHHVEDSLELKATVDSEWVRIYRLHTYPDEELELSAEIKSILWVEV
jgi:hypothetical protein